MAEYALPPPAFHGQSHKIEGLDSVFDYWQSYAPTVTSGTGTITTASCTARYVPIGKTFIVAGTVSITTNGTGATDIIVPLPPGFSWARECVGAGFSAGAGLKMLMCIGQSTSILIFNYDHTYPGQNNETLWFTVTGELFA